MSRKGIRSQGISQASMNEIQVEWRERSWKEQKDKNSKANKTKMPRTKAIKTKRSAVSLVTRVHRSKIDRTNVILVEIWVSGLRGRFREKAGEISSWLKGKEMILWKHRLRKAGRYNVFTECGIKEGMKHHLRQEQLEYNSPNTVRPSACSINKEEPARWAGPPESDRERKRLLGPVVLRELRLKLVLKKLRGSLSSEDTDGQEQSQSRQLLALGSQATFIS